MKLLRDGHGDGASDAAADDTDALNALGVGRHAERTGEIGYELALFLVIEQFGRRADNLKDNLNGATIGIDARDGEGYALALFVGAQNNKLTGLRFSSDQRRLDFHLSHRWVQDFFR